ncbi:MAG: glutamate--tRNA ligase [Deltaproteobacteria bacterium]|nr:glutamate--tRNA ligase [Deltaproteobacteria bacterium]
MSGVRTRFAPSPTGHLHVGGARTALFNFLYARHHGGTFVLRIEDTDRERSTDESTRAILESMRWLGLDWDEGPYFQSQRTGLYLEHVERLLKEGKAYRCDCPPEVVEAKRQKALIEGRKPKYDGTCRARTDVDPSKPHVVRFKAPQTGTTVVPDLLKGEVVYDNEELDDLVILRTDGSPTYNFVVVVDDALMGITHVIRGDDHLNNTPRQIQLYQALGYPLPRFAHVPMILGPDKKRLSKRHGATSVEAYRDAGFLPEALVNFLARLGWSHGDQEIFSLQELIDLFDLDGVGRSASVFNEDKLLWLNAHYIKECPQDRLVDLVRPFLERKGYDTADRGKLAVLVEAFRPRCKTLAEFAEKATPYFVREIEVDPAAAKKHLKASIAPVLADLLEAFRAVERWDVPSLERAFLEVVEGKHALKIGKAAQPLRVAVTGTTVSPGIFETLVLVGREWALERIERALEMARARAASG